MISCFTWISDSSPLASSTMAAVISTPAVPASSSEMAPPMSRRNAHAGRPIREAEVSRILRGVEWENPRALPSSSDMSARTSRSRAVRTAIGPYYRSGNSSLALTVFRLSTTAGRIAAAWATSSCWKDGSQSTWAKASSSGTNPRQAFQRCRAQAALAHHSVSFSVRMLVRVPTTNSCLTRQAVLQAHKWRRARVVQDARLLVAAVHT